MRSLSPRARSSLDYGGQSSGNALVAWATATEREHVELGDALALVWAALSTYGDWVLVRRAERQPVE
jgi:hypothetical protein